MPLCLGKLPALPEVGSEFVPLEHLSPLGPFDGQCLESSWFMLVNVNLWISMVS